MVKSREVHLIARPEGMPREEEFAVVETDLPDPADGQVLVENLYMSVDPAMRPRLSVGYPLTVSYTHLDQVARDGYAGFVLT